MDRTEEKPKARITRYLVLAAIVSSLGGLLFGFDTAVISGTTHSVQDLYKLSPTALGFFVSSALIGTILGSFCFTRLGDAWGRREILKLLALLFFVSAVGCGLAWDYTSLVIFRFIGGLGIGGSSVFGPVYVSEISPARCRGRMVLLFQYNVCLGILVAYLSNYIVQCFGLDPLTHQWRVMFSVEAVPALLFGIMLFTIPESPRWFASKGRYDEAEKVLEMVGETDIAGELQAIRDSFAAKAAQAGEALFQRKYLYPILLGFGVAAFNQLTFINGFLYYLNDTFAMVGAKFGGDLQPVIVGAFNVLACTIALFIIDRFGRKTMLLIGSWGTALPLLLAAYIEAKHELVELFPVALSIFIIFFSFSQGAVIWVYVSEIFPNAVRSKGQALGSFTHWGLCAIAAQVYPMIVSFTAGEVTPGAYPRLAIPFLFGACAMIVQFFVVKRFFIETKGVPLEEVEKKLGL